MNKAEFFPLNFVPIRLINWNNLNKVPETKIAEFANIVDLDEVAHTESPHLDLQLFAL